MRELNCKLIVSDFDGTLATSSNTVPKEVRSAINEYVDSGGIFAVCTGRMLRAILPRVREIGLKGLVVAYQGTVIAEIESGKIIRKNCIKSSDVVKICRFIEDLRAASPSYEFGINTYSDEIYYTDIPAGNIYLDRYEKITGVRAEKADVPMSQFILRNNFDCQKVTCLVPPVLRERLYNALLNKFGGCFDVTCSAEVLVEVSPYGDNKGAALKFLADKYCVPMHLTVAAGDNLNDLSMIKDAGTGVAVGNAVEGLKRAADYISVTNDEYAVAEIINKFGFKQ